MSITLPIPQPLPSRHHHRRRCQHALRHQSSPRSLVTTIGATSRHCPRRELTQIPSIRCATTAPHLNLLVAHASDGGGRYSNFVHVVHEADDERPHYGSGDGLGSTYGGGGSEYNHEGRPHHHGGSGYGRSEYSHETRPHHGAGARVPARRAGEAADVHDLLQGRGRLVQPHRCLVRTDRDDDAQLHGYDHTWKHKETQGCYCSLSAATLLSLLSAC